MVRSCLSLQWPRSRSYLQWTSPKTTSWGRDWYNTSSGTSSASQKKEKEAKWGRKWRTVWRIIWWWWIVILCTWNLRNQLTWKKDLNNAFVQVVVYVTWIIKIEFVVFILIRIGGSCLCSYLMLICVQFGIISCLMSYYQNHFRYEIKCSWLRSLNCVYDYQWSFYLITANLYYRSEN